MKLFLNQVMNSGTGTNNNNNNIETTSEESSSSIQLHKYHHEHEIEFCCNGNKDGTNDLDDTSDDISALTMPSCIFNRTYYDTTRTNTRMNMLLSIETQLLDNLTNDHAIPGEIRFASLSGSGEDNNNNNNNNNSNDDDDDLSQNYDDRIIRRSFAFDEDDDDYVQKTTTIRNDKDCDDDTDDHSYDDGLDEHIIEGDCATRNHRHLLNAFDGRISTSQPPCGPVMNPLTAIGGTEKCNKKSKALYRMSIKLNRQGWWTNPTMHRNKQLGRRGKRSRKASI
jgi:hypothetical protein